MVHHQSRLEGLPSVGDSDFAFEPCCLIEEVDDEKDEEDDEKDEEDDEKGEEVEDDDENEDSDESDEDDGDKGKGKGSEETVDIGDIEIFEGFISDDGKDLPTVASTSTVATTSTVAPTATVTSPTSQPTSYSNWTKYNPKMLRKAKSHALRADKPTTTSGRSCPPNLPSPLAAIREKEIEQKMRFQEERHAKAMQQEDGKLREQELRIKLL